MPSRHRVYRFFKEGTAGLVRAAIGFTLFASAGALLAYWSMVTYTSVELWGGITSLYMFVTGLTTGICFMIVVEMLGLDIENDPQMPTK